MANPTEPTTTGTNGNGPTAEETLAVASSALVKLDDEKTAEAITNGLHTMSPDKQGELLERLSPPDQKVTNDIWRWIVGTFSIVVLAATAALVAAVIVSFWQEVNTTMIQIVLTIFTTTAGILAGFVSGRASTGRGRA